MFDEQQVKDVIRYIKCTCKQRQRSCIGTDKHPKDCSFYDNEKSGCLFSLCRNSWNVNNITSAIMKKEVSIDTESSLDFITIFGLISKTCESYSVGFIQGKCANKEDEFCPFSLDDGECMFCETPKDYSSHLINRLNTCFSNNVSRIKTIRIYAAFVEIKNICSHHDNCDDCPLVDGGHGSGCPFACEKRFEPEGWDALKMVNKLESYFEGIEHG